MDADEGVREDRSSLRVTKFSSGFFRRPQAKIRQDEARVAYEFEKNQKNVANPEARMSKLAWNDKRNGFNVITGEVDPSATRKQGLKIVAKDVNEMFRKRREYDSENRFFVTMPPDTSVASPTCRTAHYAPPSRVQLPAPGAGCASSDHPSARASKAGSKVGSARSRT
eukprot:gnl/Hemi2/21578_TR7186_c1_g2_i1.p2 gnl/Hemi2/21578_TR7186_c1_g2~~gnl/Hemi2/21578_TR7186_c1_g2_i1.p2  ORF type:complete len:168 (+),score=25.36 gnl/Hemi2/21578_TR7186_c1_g2_i1:108-611(+)